MPQAHVAAQEVKSSHRVSSNLSCNLIRGKILRVPWIETSLEITRDTRVGIVMWWNQSRGFTA